MQNTKKYAVGSGVALRTNIPLHTKGQKLCLPVCGYLGWVSLRCTMPKNMLWVLGRRSNHTYHWNHWNHWKTPGISASAPPAPRAGLGT